MFVRPEDSHAHSLTVLNQLYEYDDFMDSIRTMVDLGCGFGLDIEWWATRTTRDETPIPLNIDCIGVDILPELPIARKYANISYQLTDFESPIVPKKNTTFDVFWCHDAFQYVVNPLKTLSNWHSVASPNAVLALIVPQTVYYSQRKLEIFQHSGCYHHHTLISLIHLLSVSGWDCRSGFFLQRPNDPWIYVMVYRSEHVPMDSKTTWYELAEKQLLPESAERSIKQHGYLRQQDLILPWIDKSITWYGK